jgi:hypothetical protein
MGPWCVFAGVREIDVPYDQEAASAGPALIRVPSCQLMRVASPARGIDANGGFPIEPYEVSGGHP